MGVQGKRVHSSVHKPSKIRHTSLSGGSSDVRPPNLEEGLGCLFCAVMKSIILCNALVSNERITKINYRPHL